MFYSYQGYRANYFAYIGLNTSDPSGMLTNLIQELEDAEEAGDPGTYSI